LFALFDVAYSTLAKDTSGILFSSPQVENVVAGRRAGGGDGRGRSRSRCCGRGVMESSEIDEGLFGDGLCISRVILSCQGVSPQLLVLRFQMSAHANGARVLLPLVGDPVVPVLAAHHLAHILVPHLLEVLPHL